MKFKIRYLHKGKLMQNKFTSYQKVSNNDKVDKNIHSILIYFIIIFFPLTLVAQPLANGKDKFLGNVLGNKIYSNFDNYWDQVTPGNAGKWGSVEGNMDSYNWTQLDNIYNYAISNGLLYKHHCLVWGQQQPSWIASLDSANQRAQVEEWVRLVGQRYPQVNFIDVVNEPFHAPPVYANALGGNGTTGWDWVVTAFEFARTYCSPEAKLILNEYNILQDNTVTNNFIALIDTLNVRGLIDGIGIQGHYFEFKGSGYTYPVSTIKYNLDRLVSTGIPVYISEFDVNEADDAVQLQNYQTYFPIFWENPGVKGMTLWGYVQYDMWKPDAYLLTDRYVERPSMQWLRTYVASPIRPVLISPLGTTNEVRNPVLTWLHSETATSYKIQVATNSSFVVPVVDTTVTADTSLQLMVLQSNTRYYWRVNASNEIGTSFYSSTGIFTTGENITDINDDNNIPEEFKLAQNYPNPFNPITTITFTLPERIDVKLMLIDILGREVMIIESGIFEAGEHKVILNAINIPSGVYLYRLQAGSFVSTKKLILMK